MFLKMLIFVSLSQFILYFNILVYTPKVIKWMTFVRFSFPLDFSCFFLTNLIFSIFLFKQDLEIVYSYLHGMEALSNLREHQLR